MNEGEKGMQEKRRARLAVVLDHCSNDVDLLDGHPGSKRGDAVSCRLCNAAPSPSWQYRPPSVCETHGCVVTDKRTDFTGTRSIMSTTSKRLVTCYYRCDGRRRRAARRDQGDSLLRRVAPPRPRLLRTTPFACTNSDSTLDTVKLAFAYTHTTTSIT